MPKQIEYTLTEKELKEVKKAMNHAPQPEVRQRALMLHLLHRGHEVKEVAEMVAVSIGTVYKCHHRWKENGVKGLANRPKSGRPLKANQQYIALLEKVIETEPERYGYAFHIWTVDRLRNHMAKETDIMLSERRFRALLSKHQFVYRQPKHDLSALQDEKVRDQAKKFLGWLKKKPSQMNSNSSLWTKQP